MPQISIIVPIYKVDQYLQRCVDSIQAQTFTDYELILIDDGSPDMSGQIGDEYTIIDECIISIHQGNAGQASARNRALDISSGVWIHYVDSDDMIHKQMLSILYKETVKGKASIIMCGKCEETNPPTTFCELYDRVPEAQYRKIDESTLLEYKTRSNCPYYWIVCAKLIKRSIALKWPFTCGRFWEDNAIVCRWLFEAEYVAEIDLPLYFYQINPTGTTKSAFSLKNLDQLWSLRQQMEFCYSVGFLEILRDTLIIYCNNCIGYYYRVLNDLKQKKTAKKIRFELRRTYHKYRKKVSLPDDVPEKILRLYSIKVLTIYRAVKGMRSAFREKGVKGAFEKVANKYERKKKKT